MIREDLVSSLAKTKSGRNIHLHDLVDREPKAGLVWS